MGFKKGHKPWNTGKTKETDERIADMAKNRSGNKLWHLRKHQFKKGDRGMLGYKHTDEARKNMSLAQKKRLANGALPPMVGKKHSKETREKLRQSTIAWHKRHNQTRENNPNWKGGLAEKSNILRNIGEAKQWRLDVYRRDNWTCQMCGVKHRRKNPLQSHHIKKFSDYPELRYDINNGITLCKKCHDKTRRHEEEYEDVFTNIITQTHKITMDEKKDLVFTLEASSKWIAPQGDTVYQNLDQTNAHNKFNWEEV